MSENADLQQHAVLGVSTSLDVPNQAVQAEFTTGWKGRSPDFDRAVNEVYAQIEGKPMGSVDSKAFCDFADSIDAEHWASFYPKEQRDYWEMRKALVDETIRQRRNELSGYNQQYQKISEGFSRMTESHPVKKGEYRGKEMSFLYSRDELMAMKYKHLALSSGSQPISSLPPQPAPSV